MQAETLQIFKNLIQNFSSLHLADTKTERTFMQLADYPHFENVCCNVLAFFFDMKEAHGFRSLFIKSLLECMRVSANCRYTEAVERGVPTGNGNRIDIFIETDNHLIAIENKLYSGANNPWDDYEAYIDTLNPANEKEPLFVLLTLKEENVGASSFRNVTYSELFAAIKRNIGMYIAGADAKWNIILNDFIRTIEELREETVLDRGFIEFYNENATVIDVLIKKKKELSKYLNSKMYAVMNFIDTDGCAVKEEYPARNDRYCAECYLMLDGMKRIGAPVYGGIHIDAKSCDIIIGIDDATSDQMQSLKKLLADKEVEHSSWEYKSEYSSDYLLIKRLDIFEAVEVIATELQRLLDVGDAV